MKLFALFSLGASVSVTPISKVVEMLEDVHKQGAAEKKEEEVKFSAFSQWCDDTQSHKNNDIKSQKTRLEQLDSSIEKAESDIDRLMGEVAFEDSEISRRENDIKIISDIRQKEKADYQATSMDYQGSLSALDRAIDVLKKQAYNREQAREFLQVEARTSSKLGLALRAYLSQSQEPDYLNREAPEAHGYEFQSGGIVDMLEKLRVKFRDENQTLNREETQKAHGYEKVHQELNDANENAKATISRRKRTLGERRAELGSFNEEHGDLSEAHVGDKKYLAETVALCQQKSSAFEIRQKTRADELVAIVKAVEILKSDTVAGAGADHLPSFLQLRSKLFRGVDNKVQERVATMLQERSEDLGSKTLALVAEHAERDPFDMVRKMVRELIFKLREEATAEAEQKGWCDTELATNKITREEKTSDQNALTAEVDQLGADISRLTQDVSDLTNAIAELDAAVVESTKTRQEDKVRNAQTIKDAKAGEAAVARAMEILKDFYANAESSTALLQQAPAEDAPETWEDAPYKGLQTENGGVVGMLEVIQSDFSRLRSETEADEIQSAKEFKKFINDSEVDRAIKSTDIEHKNERKFNKSNRLQAAKKELATNSQELDAAREYYDKLKISCVQAGVSYEERVKRREGEIQSLREALEILSGETI